MRLYREKRRFLLIASMLTLGIFLLFGQGENCEAKTSSYSKIATPNTKTYYYIRKSASMSSAKVGKFSQGCGATILKTGTKWLKVKSGSVTGYIKKSLVLTGSKLEAYAKKNQFPKKLKVNVKSLVVRKKASKSSAALTGVSKGETYKIISETAKWAKIKTDGITGYVMKTYTTCSYDLKNATPVSSNGSSQTASGTESTTTTSTASSSSAYDNVALCTVDSLNVRKSGSTTSSIVGKMNRQTAGDILVKGSSWTKIQSGTVIGYISNAYYVSGSLVPTYAQKQGISQTVTLNANMNVRASASTSSSVIGSASKGSSYKLIQEFSKWAAVAYGSKTGYLSKDYVTIAYDFVKATPVSSTAEETKSTTGSQIASYALQFKGNPYVYGGTSLTNGCDCSGFTQSVYKHFGYSIPRVSKDQAQSGTAVSLKSIQEGDLIFYANTSGVINHVGIYIGNSQVIHASSAAVGIIVSTYTYRTPVKIVRYVK